MAAVATKKTLGDVGVSVTFPANFQRQFNAGFAFYPCNEGNQLDLLTGSDFQSQWHEQKRQEANRSVMNGIQAKRSAEIKLLTGVHNYHLPKPVLGQRVYANPSFGASELVSTRRDNGTSAPFRTIEMGSAPVGSGRLRGNS